MFYEIPKYLYDMACLKLQRLWIEVRILWVKFELRYLAKKD